VIFDQGFLPLALDKSISNCRAAVLVLVHPGYFISPVPHHIMDWIPRERRKRGRPRKTWMEGVQAAMTTRNLGSEQWTNRQEWRLVSGRRRQLLKKPGQ